MRTARWVTSLVSGLSTMALDLPPRPSAHCTSTSIGNSIVTSGSEYESWPRLRDDGLAAGRFDTDGVNATRVAPRKPRLMKLWPNITSLKSSIPSPTRSRKAIKQDHLASSMYTTSQLQLPSTVVRFTADMSMMANFTMPKTTIPPAMLPAWDATISIRWK